MAASKILLLLAVGLLIGGAVASFGAFKEFRRTSSQGQGGGRTEWALPVVLLDFVAAVLIIISQLSDGRGGAGFLWYVMMACSVLMALAVASTIAVMWFSKSESKKRRVARWVLLLVLSGGAIVIVISQVLGG
jgi:hypothetical protein